NLWKLVFLPLIFITAVLITETIASNDTRRLFEAGQLVLAVVMVSLAYRNELIPLIRERFHR
ncbi:MAG: hypothetical protein WCK34_13810, partial [Bacteroidota bacterium]